MVKVVEKPFYGFVALASTIIIAFILLFSGILVFILFYHILGIVIIFIGLYAIFSYVTTIYFVSPNKSLDQSKILKLKGDELILDVGCGLGRATIGVAKQLKTGKIIGVDIWNTLEIPGNSPEKAYKNAEIEGVSDKVEFRYGDAFDLPFSDKYFDVVICSGLITSFHNDEKKLKAMSEIFRVLKTNGTFLMREPVMHLKSFIFLTPTIIFLKMPTKIHWENLLEKSGFRNIKYFSHRVAGSFLMIKTKK